MSLLTDQDAITYVSESILGPAGVLIMIFVIVKLVINTYVRTQVLEKNHWCQHMPLPEFM